MKEKCNDLTKCLEQRKKEDDALEKIRRPTPKDRREDKLATHEYLRIRRAKT